MKTLVGALLVHLTLISLNDVYQTAPDPDGRGGMARVATARRAVRETAPDAVFVFSGDTISPSMASTVFRGKQMIAAWNAVGLDLATFGNHEFDFGPDVLTQRIKESRFQWIASNVIDRRTGRPFGGAAEWVIRDVRGVKVGFLGLLTPDALKSSHPGDHVDIQDPNETARKLVPRLRAAGAQVVVALTHLAMADDRALAAAAPLDLIAGAHDHVLIQTFAHNTPIVRAGSDAQYLGRVDMSWSPSARKVQSVDFELIPITDRVPEDPEVARTLTEYEVQLSRELDQVIARSLVPLDAVQVDNQSRETNLGSFIADVFRDAAHAELALVNGGTIRSNATYGPGYIRKRDVLSVLPFENTVVTLRMTGAQIREALEHGVSRVGTKADGRFPQISGMRFEFNATRPPGSRVTGVWVQGEPLDPKRVFTVATNAYLAKGGDGYDLLTRMPRVVGPENGPAESEVVDRALLRMGTVAPLVRNRILRRDTP